MFLITIIISILLVQFTIKVCVCVCVCVCIVKKKKKLYCIYLFFFTSIYFSLSNFSTPSSFSVHCQSNISNVALIKMYIDLLVILLYLDFFD